MDEFFATATELPQDAGRYRSDHLRLRGAGQDRGDRLRADLPALVGGLGQAAPHPRAHAARASSSTRRRRRSTSRPTRASTRRSSARSSTAPARSPGPQDGDAPHRRARRRHRSGRRGATRQNALFGTYVWSEDETDGDARHAAATATRTTACADIVRTYITDELPYQEIVDTTTGTVDDAVATAIKNHPNEPAYRDLLQHYAIPGTPPLRPVPHGQPDQGLRARLLPAAGRAARDRHRRHLRRRPAPTS